MRERKLIIGPDREFQRFARLKVRAGANRIRPGFIKSLRFSVGLVWTSAREIPNADDQNRHRHQSGNDVADW